VYTCRGSILCGVEGLTPYGKPVFDCDLNIAWRADLLLAPTIISEDKSRREGRVDEKGVHVIEDVIGAILKELPAGLSRMAAKMLCKAAARLVAQVVLQSIPLTSCAAIITSHLLCSNPYLTCILLAST